MQERLAGKLASVRMTVGQVSLRRPAVPVGERGDGISGDVASVAATTTAGVGGQPVRR